MGKLSILFRNWTSCSFFRSINLPFSTVTLLFQHKYEEGKDEKGGQIDAVSHLHYAAFCIKVHFLACISSTKWDISLSRAEYGGWSLTEQSALLIDKYIAHFKELILVLHTVLQEHFCNYLIWYMQRSCRVLFHK